MPYPGSERERRILRRNISLGGFTSQKCSERQGNVLKSVMHVLSCCLAHKIICSLMLSWSLWLRKLPIVTANNTKCQELFVNQLIYDSFKSISEDYPRPTITCPQNNIGTLLFLYFLRYLRRALTSFQGSTPSG